MNFPLSNPKNNSISSTSRRHNGEVDIVSRRDSSSQVVDLKNITPTKRSANFNAQREKIINLRSQKTSDSHSSFHPPSQQPSFSLAEPLWLEKTKSYPISSNRPSIQLTVSQKQKVSSALGQNKNSLSQTSASRPKATKPKPKPQIKKFEIKKLAKNKKQSQVSFYEQYQSQISQIKNGGFTNLTGEPIKKTSKTKHLTKTKFSSKEKPSALKNDPDAIPVPISQPAPSQTQTDTLDQAIGQLLAEWQKRKAQVQSQFGTAPQPPLPPSVPPPPLPQPPQQQWPSQPLQSPPAQPPSSKAKVSAYLASLLHSSKRRSAPTSRPPTPSHSQASASSKKNLPFFEDYEKRLHKIEKERIRSNETILEKINRLQKNLEKQPAKPEKKINLLEKQSLPRTVLSEKTASFTVSSFEKPRGKTSPVREVVQEALSPKIRKALVYSSSLALILVIFPVALVAFKGLQEKNAIEKFGAAAYGNLKEAQASIEGADVEKAGKNFDLAYQNFQEAREKLDEVGGITTKTLDFVPGVSKIESGRNLAKTGENLALAGKEITQAMSLFMDQKEELKQNFLDASGDKSSTASISLTGMVFQMEDHLKKASSFLEVAENSAGKINPDDFPEEEQAKIATLKESLPFINESLDEFFKYTDVFQEILGGKGSRKYLILFQNNHEMRATGGFIGTYGVVKVNEGKIEDLKVDGIYNPDGQLKERIIPPKPIQKMSAAWSMHDANWWPDFPTSAEKVSWFYEKTGGPTVDGVISLTPKIIVDLLEIIGPVEVTDSDRNETLTITSQNFMEEIQYQVEVDYDKEENRPKKILADLTPQVISKVFAASPEDWPSIINVLSQSLKERHLYLYSFDYDIQQLISDMGWSGEILKTKKDYLSVVNTNISGLKTDGTIQQKIYHHADIQKDGSIVDTVTIERQHQGGNSEFEWHNAVNANWLRIYVPEGSELISATGFTREFVDSPLDYEKLDFKEDFGVKKMEESYQIDEDSATRIYSEEEKTVFANWVYTSPGETTTVTFKYLLPFRLDLESAKKPADAYSLLLQKQGGAENCEIDLKLTGLKNYEYVYHYPENLEPNPEGWNLSQEFDTDKFLALVVKKKD